MVAPKKNEYLFENLKKLGFKGSKKDLRILDNAEKISELNMLKNILESFKKLNNNIEEPALHFYSIKNNNKFQITFYFFDDSRRISNGFHGEIGVRVLYGCQLPAFKKAGL